MKISKDTRWVRAGAAQAAVIVENVHGLYQREHALQYMGSLIPPLVKELKRRKKEKRK